METVKNLDLSKYNFPEVTGVDLAFPTFNTDHVLLKEAEDRGLLHGNTQYNKLFSTLFFSGGKVKFKEGIDTEFQTRAWRYMRALIGSFSPKHEHKEAVCALILSEICEPELDQA